ncbi:twin-arginine translocation signal domain-containing protein [Halomonas sp. MA07-2]|uniref:twin-arginine translocation signal domain-containing protein n=1 Tax=unclassified Halomonas TaxID=2609666 RepID=UPI003EEABB93
MSRSHDPKRRRFLRAMGTGGALAGTAAVIGHVSLSQADVPRDDTPPGDADKHYRETDHVRAYYATLRD